MATRPFGRPVGLRREVEGAVASHTARAAEKMWRQGLATASMDVFAHTNRHRLDHAQQVADDLDRRAEQALRAEHCGLWHRDRVGRPAGGLSAADPATVTTVDIHGPASTAG